MREILTNEFLPSGSDSRNLVIVIWGVGPKSDIAVLEKPAFELQKSDIRVTSPRVLLYKGLYNEGGSAWGSNPLPSSFLTGKVPISYTLHCQMVSHSHTF